MNFGPPPATRQPAVTPVHLIDPTTGYPFVSRAGQLITTRELADYPVGGGTFLIIPGPPKPVAKLQQRDGICRRATITLSAQPRPPEGFGDPPDDIGVYARVTIGNARGSQVYLTGFPRMFPVQASFVLVEAQLCSLPFEFAQNGQQNMIVPASDLGATVTATIAEGGDAELPDVLLRAPVQSLIQVFELGGPVFVGTIKFANRGTSAVQIVISDRQSSAVSPPVVDKVVALPGNVDFPISLPFFRGLRVQAVNDFTASYPWGGDDPNAADVEVSVYGQYIGVA